MKKAFTLIELLIVIGIIVVLTAIAVPRFDNFGSKAEVADKADEIKSLIEKGITSSIGSQITVEGEVSNGTMITAKFGTNADSVTLNNVKYQNISNPAGSMPVVLSTETVELPDYMHLTPSAGGASGALYAYFIAPTTYHKDASLGANNFALRITSDKTDREAVVTIISQKNSKDARETVKVSVDD